MASGGKSGSGRGAEEERGRVRQASGGRGAVGPPDPPISAGTFEPAAKAPPARKSRPLARLKKVGIPRAWLKNIMKKP